MIKQAIHIENLSFGYTKSELVIDNLNLNVPQGAVYGFLGANGAGKTTTLKMILGLIKSYKGKISIHGKDIKTHYPEYLAEVGSLIENPSFYGHLSATDNLKIWSRYFNCDANRIPEVLKLVDLQNAAKKKTQHFSTGMKQRLGLATALLHDPGLLILDEPTNGLDPMGIIELRSVLSRLNSEGKTLILSSHILSEVEKIVSHLGILKDGSLVFEGTIDELHSKKEKNLEITIEVNDSDRAMQFILHDHKSVNSDNTISVHIEDKNQIPTLINNLSSNGIKIYEIKQHTKDLEAMFLSISNKNKTELHD